MDAVEGDVLEALLWERLRVELSNLERIVQVFRDDARRGHGKAVWLVNGLTAVAETRARNGDVFVMPDGLMAVLYTIEELTEFVRAVQALEMPSHLRRANDHTDLNLEWGQAAMMLLTVAMIYQVDVDAALGAALARVDDRCSMARRALEASK